MQPKFLSKNVSDEDFLEMLEFLCCFGKNVVNEAIKIKKIWSYFTTYVALESLLLSTAARRAIFPSMCGPQNIFDC